jgi:hypothetical protein
MEAAMAVVRLGLGLILLVLVSACGTLHCAENSDNSRVNGGCGVQQTF